MKIRLPKGEKLVSASGGQDETVTYLTRPAEFSDRPTTYTLHQVYINSSLPETTLIEFEEDF